MVLDYDITRVVEMDRLTTGLSEALKCLSIANCACNDNFQGGTKIEEHANCSN
jgi:hypothetical protein